MDPEFQRALTFVLVAGTVVFGIGAIVLFFAFRAFGRKGAGGARHMALIGGLIVFLAVCCGLLLALAYQ